MCDADKQAYITAEQVGSPKAQTFLSLMVPK